MDPVSENRQNAEKERLERRFNEGQAQSKSTMISIKKDNRETSRELERISKLEDPIKMFEDKKEKDKERYKELKEKLSQMNDLA